jgi:hypothetical protein
VRSARAVARTVPAELGAADKRRHVRIRDLHFDPGIRHGDHLAGDDGALADARHGLGVRVAGDLLDAERDALLLHIDVEHLGLHHLALLVVLDGCSPGRFQSRSERWTMPSTSPSRPRNRPNSVLFLTSPSTCEPTGCFSANSSHGIAHGLLEAERDAALGGVDLQDDHFHLLGGGDDLAGWTFFLVQLISETWISPSIPAPAPRRRRSR